MTASAIPMPSAGLFRGAVITDCEWRLRTFVERDAYVAYDWTSSHSHPPGDSIQQHHIFAVNSAMRARTPRAAWEPFLGSPLAELSGIPHDLDLIDAPVEYVEPALLLLGELTERLTAVPGLTEMAVSKVLYLLRPSFVAIADSYIRDALGVWRGRPSDTMVRVARAVRELGLQNSEALQRLSNYSTGLPPFLPAAGRHRGGLIPVRLSKARILDILIWTEAALHGPTPNQQWLKWHAEAHPAC
jgi:hypothetical protein